MGRPSSGGGGVGGGGGRWRHDGIAMIFSPSHLLCTIKSQMGGGGNVGRGNMGGMTPQALFVTPLM